MNADRRMGPTYPSTEGAASARDARRALQRVGAFPAAPEPALELLRPDASEPPRLQRAEPLEGDAMAVRAVDGAPVVGIAAFLDGIQQSRVLAYWRGGIPVVHGTVAAAVRLRRDRTLVRWRADADRVDRALYAPRAALDDSVWTSLSTTCAVRDTLSPDERGPWHPQDLVARALHAVQRQREALETACAERWCAAGDGPLFVDGGIAAAGGAAHSPLAVGVVKSHRTLYVDGAALPLVLGLRAGERTTMFTVASPRRAAVASWYLRLRDPAAHDALWGLVRVEIARDDADGARADLVSRWILAERAPLALPDPRWGAMAYGIRLTEEYLRAVSR